jgi:YHS domain-containing protein
MAIFDNIGGLLGDLGIGVPRNTGLISDTADIDAINKRALMSGGVNALLTYLATPKNLNAGSPLPYLGRAALSGFGAAQNTVDQALNTAYRNRMLSSRDDNIRTYEKDRQKITEQYDPLTKTWSVLGTSSLDAPKEAKEPSLPTSAQEFERAKSDPAYMKFLREKWDAENKALKASAQAEESAYRYKTPQQSFSVTAGGKTYYFKDQNSANAFRQKAGIK